MSFLNGQGGDISDLANLLGQSTEEDEKRHRQEAAAKQTMAYASPAAIGPQTQEIVEEPKPPSKNDIWTTDEVSTTGLWNDPSDPRKRPEFNMKYKQQV